MFFTRSTGVPLHSLNCLAYHDLRNSYVVLYKILQLSAEQPNLRPVLFQIQSHVVLYKMPQASLAISALLSLPVFLNIGWMLFPITTLVIGMTLAPFLLTQQTGLSIVKVRLLLLSAIGGLVASSTRE